MRGSLGKWCLILNGLLVMGLLALTSCRSEQTGRQDDSLFSPSISLPTTVPADLVLTYRWSSNRRVRGRVLRLRAGRSTIERRHRGLLARAEFEATEQEVEGLYQMLRTHQFARITSHEVLTYDAGGETVSLDFGGSRVSQANDDSTNIGPEWMPRWRKITQELSAYADTIEERHSVACQVGFSSTLSAANFRFTADTGRTLYWHRPEGKEKLRASLDFRLLPGEHRLDVCIDDCAVSTWMEFQTNEGCFFVVGLNDGKPKITRKR